MEALIAKLKNEIIDVLNLTEMTPESIDENEPLFVEGLGLDSIDALELIVLAGKKLRFETCHCRGRKDCP